MDRLLSTGEQVSMTLLAMAIEARGYRAMSFSGRQAGIETDNAHAKAKITLIHADRIKAAIDAGVIPVVAGFQGIDPRGDITTLGRGGSDTTAVAVAYGIGADVCEIYSDVDGVYSADPRVAPVRASWMPSATRTCWSFPAREQAFCKAAPLNSRASTRLSFIPGRRFPTHPAR